MKKYPWAILITFGVANLSGCSYYLNSKSATEKRVDIIIAETYNKYQNREIIFERMTMDFPEYHEAPLIIAENARKEISQLKEDGSEVNILYDGYGNKTETRHFFNDKLIKFVVIKTSANGEKKAFVYGQNGEIKLLPEEFLELILQLPVDEIARSVEILEGRKENETLANLQKPQTAQPVTANPTGTETAAKPSDSAESPTEHEKVYLATIETAEKPAIPEPIPEKK